MKSLLSVLALLFLAGCGHPRVNSEPQFTTKYAVDDAEYGGVPVSKYTEAKMRNLFVYHFEAAPEVIFDDVSRLKGFAEVRWDDNGTGIEDGPGKGVIRWVKLMGKEIREEFMEYDPPNMHFYRIEPEKSEFKFRFKNHIGVVTVEPDGGEGSILTWRIYYDYILRHLSPKTKTMLNIGISGGLDGLVKTHGGTRLKP